jgi:glycine/D-amino acid oxidase-like deaminating enzyme
MRARLVIVGKGTTGLCLALEAARRTDPIAQPVVLLAGPETTSPRLELCRHDLDGSGWALEARHGLRYWSGLRARTGRDPGWNPCGAIVEEGGAEAAAGWSRLLELGVDVRRAGERFVDEEAGTLDGEQARACLEALAREAGAVVRGGEEALEVLVLEGGGVEVRTATDRIRCDEAILAGAGACALAPGGGPELARTTWSERVHGEEAALDGDAGDGSDERNGGDGEEEPLVLNYLPSGGLGPAALADALEGEFADEGPGGGGVRARVRGGLVAAPERGGRLWVGGVDYDGEGAEALATSALGDCAAGEERTRAIWTARDGAPIVGPVPGSAGVWLACGFGARAGLFAPACAEGLALRLLDGSTGWFTENACDPGRSSVSWPSRSR